MDGCNVHIQMKCNYSFACSNKTGGVGKSLLHLET